MQSSLAKIPADRLQQQQQKQQEQGHDQDEQTLDLDGWKIFQVIVPIAACSLYTVILVRLVGDTPVFARRLWNSMGLFEQEDLMDSLLDNVVTVMVLISLMVLVTLVIFLALYMQWHRCLSYYFYVPSIMIMTFINPFYMREILMHLNWFGLDLITMAILTWNFAFVGMAAIFGLYVNGPTCLQHCYLIHNSALMAASLLSFLPGWAPYILMMILIVWDLFAVLSPYGPLNLIIKMAEDSGIVDMPGLVYTTMVSTEQSASSERKRNEKDEPTPNEPVMTNIKTLESDMESNRTSRIANRKPHTANGPMDENQENLEPKASQESVQMERGLNIGLGDFIFYGVLMGLSCRGQKLEDFYSPIAVLNTILVGLVLTLIILITSKRAVPALPISISLGLTVLYVTSTFVPSLANRLAYSQIFI